MREKHKIREIERQIKKEFTKANIPTGKEVCTKQLFNMIDKVEHVDVNYSEIETFLPDIMKKLEWMDKEELIRKFVSQEFNRFLEYYRNAPDLNVDESREKSKQDKNRQDKGNKDKRTNKNGNFTRLFITLGHKDKIVPQRLIGMINDYTHQRHIEIGKIDILDNFSYVEVEDEKVEAVINAFEGKFVKGRPIAVEIAESKGTSSRGKSSDRRSGGDRRRESSRDNGNDRRTSSKRSSDRKKDSSRRDKDRKRYR